ncbi:trypsin-like serine protease [Thiorhodococcus minor]|uniref:S1 family peptidase n=1 Tax=Thiorhodococcus minor TaxID=57489 RepID=A0A6M0K0V1_9GAMM|nr:trypsin-like serine protease [Thiorhodococcus minor]NEV63370.1 S1 family peptidase [Thiorhodococcus minor]
MPASQARRVPCYPGRLLFLLLCLISLPSAALINGQLDRAGAYGAVVTIWRTQDSRCSAAKIAPRTFLTAAHCVIDVPSGGLAPAFRTGGQIRVSNAAIADWPSAEPLVVARTDLPPRFERGLRRLYAYQQGLIADYRKGYSGAELDRRIRLVHADSRISDRFPDAALVRVAQATPRIPVIPVRLAPLAAGAEVILVGYGCERVSDWRRGRSRRQAARRTWGRSRVIRVDSVNFYSFAGERLAGSATLCPGDSGGPVLFEGDVVGVHGTVWGLSHRDTARSNMSVNLHGLRDWGAWPD